MVLFTSKQSNFKSKYKPNVLKKVVHYDWYMHKSERLDVITNGDAEIKTYLKYLSKAIIKKIKLNSQNLWAKCIKQMH